MYTRKDDEKNEHLRTVIEAGTRKIVESARMEKAERNARNEAVNDTGQNQQMMYYIETLAAGTRFYWGITLRDVTDVEFEAFLIVLNEFSQRPYIGGKANVGHGHVSLNFAGWYSIDSRLVEANASAVSTPAGAAYLEHLRSSSDGIRCALGAM
jgi:CRISPR type IV-associated protein Csf2